jgi:hypothetical protein
VIPADTEATLTAQPNGAIAIVTPHPLAQSTESPSSTFPVMPMATPFGPGAMPHPRMTAHPSPTPAQASPAPSPSPSA